MERTLLSHAYAVAAGDFTTAGQACAQIKGILKQLGVAPQMIRRIAIAAYEVELNLVIHSLGGELTMDITQDGITLTAKDAGPGIEDIELAMREGYSTAPDSVRNLGFGAGMGLPNMKRNAGTFSIESALGAGTTIVMGFEV